MSMVSFAKSAKKCGRTMSLDKGVQHGKEHRVPFRRSKRFDRTCRCHGSCGYCRANRLFNQKRAEMATDKRTVEPDLEDVLLKEIDTIDELDDVIAECDDANTPFLKAEVARRYGTHGPQLLRDARAIILRAETK